LTAPCRAEPREGILEARTPVPPDRVSVIVPVKNEESSIAALLTSLIEQTVSPAEIVITDGGSRDRTRELVRQMQANSPIPIVLVETGDAFPGRGRNLAIRHATNDWIACIDAGIVAAPNWLEELVLVARAHPEASVIFGRYQAVTDSFFSKCAAIVYGPAPGDRGRTSIACCMMSRSVWERIGGFREDLRSAEDLVFFRALGDAGVKAAFSEALVRWTIPGDMPSTFKRFFVYSRYGVKAGLWKEPVFSKITSGQKLGNAWQSRGSPFFSDSWNNWGKKWLKYLPSLDSLWKSIFQSYLVLPLCWRLQLPAVPSLPLAGRN